jgi:hypothetical protein
VQIPGAVNSSHAPNPGDILDQISADEGGAGFEVLVRSPFLFTDLDALGCPLRFQPILLFKQTAAHAATWM